MLHRSAVTHPGTDHPIQDFRLGLSYMLGTFHVGKRAVYAFLNNGTLNQGYYFCK